MAIFSPFPSHTCSSHTQAFSLREGRSHVEMNFQHPFVRLVLSPGIRGVSDLKKRMALRLNFLIYKGLRVRNDAFRSNNFKSIILQSLRFNWIGFKFIMEFYYGIGDFNFYLIRRKTHTYKVK